MSPMIKSDEWYLRVMFFIRMHRFLHLRNPKTFSEKLQWLKLYAYKPEYTMMVDKYLVKEYVKEMIGKEYIIPTIGVWNRVEDVDWNALPEKFVLKCNHDSGGVVVCRDKSKLDIEKAKAKLSEHLKYDYFWPGRDKTYKHVERKIIAEKFMEDNQSHDLIDYKLMCFNGKVKCTFTCTDRFSDSGLKVTFYDREWNIMPFCRKYPREKTPMQKPEAYGQMVQLAEILSENIPFVRVDFYNINGKIYFGELTFYPGAGMEIFYPGKWDRILGSWIVLPNAK